MEINFFMSNDFHFQMAVQRKIPSVYTEIPITCTPILKLKCLLMKIKFSVIIPKNVALIYK